MSLTAEELRAISVVLWRSNQRLAERFDRWRETRGPKGIVEFMGDAGQQRREANALHQ